MNSNERKEWLRNLKPGDKVRRLGWASKNDGTVGTVVADERLDQSRWATAIAVDFGGPKLEHFSTPPGFGGVTCFPFGSPAIIGDLSCIFPHDCNVDECKALLQLRYAIRDESAIQDMPPECVAELNAVLEKHGFSARHKDEAVMRRFRP